MKKIFGTLALLLLAGVILVWYHSTSDLKPLGKILIVGTSADFPPFSFRTPSDEIVGFDIDVVKEVARRLSLDVDLQDKPFGTLIPQIELGQIHAIAAGMTPTVDRAKRVQFTKSYLAGSPLLVVTKSSLPSITSIEDLKGKQVIVNTGYTADTYMSSLPDIELLRLPKVTDALTALDYGKADAFVTAAFSIEPYVKEDDTRFSTFKIPETNEENALALSKNLSQEFVQNVQKALDDMEADGTLGALKKKWNVI
jgi:polar amino acid transport system substrate-binding protein